MDSLNRTLKLSELMGALSYALDLTEGQPPGHCVRCCWIGMHVGRALDLSEGALWDLYYTLLLKDLGCSSNAARICQLYLTDDLSFKRAFRRLDSGFIEKLNFGIEHAGVGRGLVERFRLLLRSARNAEQVEQELTSTRCQRGASIARRLRFSDAVAEGIHGLDEHWDGRGHPAHLAGQGIPLYSRIALLAQVVDVFHSEGGPEPALEEARRRSGTWLDPELVQVLEVVARDPRFWATLGSSDVTQAVFAEEPADHSLPVDEDYLDDITAAFGEVVDSKSPYTAGHSGRVGLYADQLAEELGIDQQRRRWLRRGALLHDVGKLGVSNAFLDKPGKLEPAEWEAVQQHAAMTEEILRRVPVFEELAVVAAAHHERPDGTGYPRGLRGDAIALETRIITTADIFDAITAERPYRGAVPIPKTLEIMAQSLDTALDRDCYNALVRIARRIEA